MNAVVHPRLDTTNPLSRRAPIREHEGEPVPGLPERLPPGETILWQGSPDARPLARRAFHLRGLALYFLVLAVWRGVVLWPAGPGEAATGVALILLLGAVPIAILSLVARLSARTTLYTLTNRRLILRVGIALPLTINLPFAVIGSAATRVEEDGSGDIVLGVLPPHRVSYVALWPHVRPWRFARPEPMLRGIPDASAVAAILARALAAHAEQPVQGLRAADDAADVAPQPVAA